jgi:hypothetical protein
VEDHKVDIILHDLSEQATIHAVEANLFALIKIRGLWSHTEVIESPELLSCFTSVPFPHFNAKLRAKIPQSQTDSRILSTFECCRTRKVPMGWIIGPSTSPASLADDLLKHGFVHAADNSGMAVDLWQVIVPRREPIGLTIQ